MITAGVGIGQTRLIGAYDGGTKVATVTPNWTTNPTSASVYQIVPMGRVDVAGWLGQGVTLSGNNKPDVNIYEISDIVGAADNLEEAFDGDVTGAGLIDSVDNLRADAIDATVIADDAIDYGTFAATRY
jgi:hypothetical protein